jgi:hypothetical protein
MTEDYTCDHSGITFKTKDKAQLISEAIVELSKETFEVGSPEYELQQSLITAHKLYNDRKYYNERI